MKTFMRALQRLAIWRQEQGQDLVEYALLAGFVALASGFFAPGMTESMDMIYSRLASKLEEAVGQ